VELRRRHNEEGSVPSKSTGAIQGKGGDCCLFTLNMCLKVLGQKTDNRSTEIGVSVDRTYVDLPSRKVPVVFRSTGIQDSVDRAHI